MDVKNDDLFDEAIENEAPKSATTEELLVTLPQNDEGEAVLFNEGTTLSLPFPQKDYNKKGRLKKVRGRVLGKLLKAEWKYYFPITLAVMAVVLFCSVYMGVVMRKEMQAQTYEEIERMIFFSLSSILLFVLASAGGVLFAQIYPVIRYNKNFFKDEGYLTFSIPASAEEQVFAKRIAAVLCTLAVCAALVLGGYIVMLLTDGMSDWGMDMILDVELLLGIDTSSTGNAVLSIVEVVVSGIVGLILMPSMYGAMSCVLSKTAGKKKTLTILILVFLAVGLVESVFSYLLAYGTSWLPVTAAGIHIAAWVTIVLEAALAAGCIFFEIWYLKNKLDLK